jgi:hypothetical protein
LVSPFFLPTRRMALPAFTFTSDSTVPKKPEFFTGGRAA